MNEQQAEDLAVHAAQTWHGPNAYDWQQEIQNLDHDRCIEAFRRMKAITGSHADLAGFRGHYRATAPDVVTVNSCDTCGKPIDDPRRWRHADCQPDPNIINAMQQARAQLNGGTRP